MGPLTGSTNIRRLAEVARAGNLEAIQRRYHIAEAGTTADFAHLMDTVDRGFMAGYIDDKTPTTFETLGRRRDTQELARAGGKGQGKDYQIYAPREIPVVAEKGEYLPIQGDQTSYILRTYKYGATMDFSWEAYLADNRDLQLLMQYPQNWGESARYTQEKVFTAAYAGKFGGNTSYFFNKTVGNFTDGDSSSLDATSLQAGIQAIRSFADPANNVAPYSGKLTLVVPPALEFTARKLVDPTFLRAGVGDTVANTFLVGSVDLLVNPFLPAVDTTNGNTAWYLFADPAIRPAVRYGYLAGYDQPELWMRDSDALRFTGGPADPFEGSFVDDDIEFKLRFTFGADLLDWRGAYMSKGAS